MEIKYSSHFFHGFLSQFFSLSCKQGNLRRPLERESDEPFLHDYLKGVGLESLDFERVSSSRLRLSRRTLRLDDGDLDLLRFECDL